MLLMAKPIAVIPPQPFKLPLGSPGTRPVKRRPYYVIRANTASKKSEASKVQGIEHAFADLL
ncbi:MAG: hypothetical protein K7J15_00260 [Candidatus Regiella insecticola]|nr:hypothetical protein [Candidatus Regiella insecticola]